MMSRSRTTLAFSAIAGMLALALGFGLLRGTKPTPDRERLEEEKAIEERFDASEPERQQAEPAVATSDAAMPPAGVASVASDPRPLDEPALMATLRELRHLNPMLSLTLAREGNARFKDSPNAAERAWIVVKSLSEMGRHDEARAEARAMFQRYRGTSWADDVYRHMLVNPASHPAERGYGKVLELE